MKSFASVSVPLTSVLLSSCDRNPVTESEPANKEAAQGKNISLADDMSIPDKIANQLNELRVDLANGEIESANPLSDSLKHRSETQQ